MATYKPIRKTANGTEEIKIPYAVLADAPDLSKYVTTDGGTINKSKTIKMDASANSDGANLKWGTVNHKNPYIGYASDQSDGTFVVGSLLGTNYASGLAIGGGSGNLLWKGTKVATTNDIPTNYVKYTAQTLTDAQKLQARTNIGVPTKTSELTNDSGFITSDGTVKSVVDYGDTSKNIKIGYSGAGITGDQIRYIAGYTTGDSGSVARIKDISKDAMKAWLGYAQVATSGSYNDLVDTPNISGLMPKSGGTFTGEVKFGSTENFQGYYIKRMIGGLGIGTRYADLDSSYKDGTYHRMWRLRFPSGSNFWGKIKITLYGGYSSFNASGVMSKSITCNFNTSNIYNNVGCYDGLGVNVEQDFRISEAIWNATASAWEVLIWQKNLNGNNSPAIMLECWTRDDTNYINAFNGIAAQTVELTQSTSYSAQKASSTGGTKTVEWEALPVYENPLGEEIATVADVKGIKVDNAANADVAGEARKISNNMLFEGYKHLGNGAMSETTMKYNGSDIRKLYFGDEFQFLNADGTTTDDPNKNHRLTLKPTGVAAGTYNSVTVDAKGRVTAGTNTPAVDTSNLAKLDAENTFTKGQVITGSTSGGYSINASGYVKGSWLQAGVKSNYGSGTGMVCVFDGSGWIYYRTPSEILSEANGVPKSAFSLEGTTLTITI